MGIYDGNTGLLNNWGSCVSISNALLSFTFLLPQTKPNALLVLPFVSLSSLFSPGFLWPLPSGFFRIFLPCCRRFPVSAWLVLFPCPFGFLFLLAVSGVLPVLWTFFLVHSFPVFLWSFLSFLSIPVYSFVHLAICLPLESSPVCGPFFLVHFFAWVNYIVGRIFIHEGFERSERKKERMERGVGEE